MASFKKRAPGRRRAEFFHHCFRTSHSPSSTNQTLAVLLHRLNFVLRGWTNYHRHGVAAKTFAFLSAFAWRRVWCWLCHKYPKTAMGVLRRRHTQNWWPEQDEVRLFKPTKV